MASDVKAMTQVASPPATAAAKEISGDMARKVRPNGEGYGRRRWPRRRFCHQITFFSSGGSFLDGYVLSLIGVALTQIVPAFGLTDVWARPQSASVLVGIFVGTITGLPHRRHRPQKMFISSIWWRSGCSRFSERIRCQAWQLVAAQFLIGVFVSADYPACHLAHRRVHAQGHRSISALGIVSGMVSGRHHGVPPWWATGSTAWKTAEMDARQRRGACVVLLVGRHDSRVPLVAGEQGAPCRAGRDGCVFRLRCLAPRKADGQDAAGALLHGSDTSTHVFLGVFILCQVVPMYAIYT